MHDLLNNLQALALLTRQVDVIQARQQHTSVRVTLRIEPMAESR